MLPNSLSLWATAEREETFLYWHILISSVVCKSSFTSLSSLFSFTKASYLKRLLIYTSDNMKSIIGLGVGDAPRHGRLQTPALDSAEPGERPGLRPVSVDPGEAAGIKTNRTDV